MFQLVDGLQILYKLRYCTKIRQTVTTSKWLGRAEWPYSSMPVVRTNSTWISEIYVSIFIVLNYRYNVRTWKTLKCGFKNYGGNKICQSSKACLSSVAPMYVETQCCTLTYVNFGVVYKISRCDYLFLIPGTFTLLTKNLHFSKY